MSAGAASGVAAGVFTGPGRVNLIGEHTDYNEGFVLPFAIAQHAEIRLQLRNDSQVFLSTEYEGKTVQLRDISAFTPESITDPEQMWANYVLGVAWAMAQHGHRIPGFEAHLSSTVPVGAGLSSSAAIECAMAVGLNELLGLKLSRRELVQDAQTAENDVVGAPTGILDQSASLMSARDHALFVDCRSLETELIPCALADAGLGLLVCDTRVRHDHASGEYAQRRASCDLAAAALQVPALRDVSATQLELSEPLLDPVSFRRARHVVTENQRVLDAVAALKAKDFVLLGALMSSSHVSMRDDFEISTPELDLVVTTAVNPGAAVAEGAEGTGRAVAKPALGARMTGGGFGGSAIVLTELENMDALSQTIMQRFSAHPDMPKPQLFTVEASAGARRVN